MKSVLTADFIRKVLEAMPSTEKSAVSLHELQDFVKKSDWFDKKQQGRANKLIIGVYNRQHLVKAPVNPITVKAGFVADDTEVLKINERVLYPADVVYSGISMNKISNIDTEKLNYTLDFYLWFRYQDGVKGANNVEFLNSLHYAKLLDIVKETSWRKKEKIETPDDALTASLVKEESFNGESYRCYRVMGRFKTDNAKIYTLGQQNLYVIFRNYEKNKFKLNYVSDYINNNKGIYSIEEVKKADADIELKFNLIDHPKFELNYAFSYINSSDKTMLGAPQGVAESNAFSQFVAEYRIQPVIFSFRGIVSWINKTISGNEDQIKLPIVIILFAVNLGLFLLSVYGDHSSAFNEYSTLWWLLQLSVIFFMLLFGELVGSQLLYDLKNSPWGADHRSSIGAIMFYWGKSVAILGWIIPAYYVTSAFNQFLWNPIQKKTGADAPNVLRLFVTVMIYTLAVLGIMGYVLDITANSLIATSGAVAILFAFASKIDLSNVLAGLGITFSKVFKIGDWIKVDGVAGKVVEMTPRSTKILTFDSSIVNIPNSNVADSVIENFNRPSLPYRLIIHMETVPIYRFERVEKILLDAVASTEGILVTPEPYVIFKGQGDSCQIYEVAFFIDDYSKHAALWQATWRRIWRHLEQAGIELATPQREIFMPKALEGDAASPLTVMNNCAAFLGLTDESKAQLAENTKCNRYQTGEVIVRQGEHNENLFIITEGVVSLIKPNSLEKRLGVAEVFAMDDESAADAVATALTQTEVLVVKREDFLAASEIGNKDQLVAD
ncbi:MAG: hypothetical protein D3924_03920 [Candidatus Electrothrix sp. AR4]|nr:hypothetical protein [Candidatus Electrothrix sp. AR4]